MIPELRTLIAVARHGTFAAAGQRLGLTQAAVSGHVRRLEHALGCPLFDRTGRSARLNAAGARTLDRAETIVAAFDALGEPARDQERAEPLRIGAIASVQSTIVARALVPFRVEYPACRLHLVPGVSLQLVDRIDAGELDMAIVICPTFDLPSNLAWVPLVREDYALLAPRAAGEDRDWRAIIATCPFIRYDRASIGGRQVDRFFRREGVVPDEWLEADDLQAMTALVESGIGCAIVPVTEAVKRLPDSVRRVPLGTRAPQRAIGVVHQTPMASARMSALVTRLVEAAPA